MSNCCTKLLYAFYYAIGTLAAVKCSLNDRGKPVKDRDNEDKKIKKK